MRRGERIAAAFFLADFEFDSLASPAQTAGMSEGPAKKWGNGGEVAELQGLYGPYSFPEKLLQKIWLRGDFDRANALTTAGRRVQVIQPGRWNLLGGPDFLGARLRIGEGSERTVDVELHLHAADWAAHGHARDEAYDRVALHVVLFPPGPRHVTLGHDGNAIPVLALLPLLHHDLEEYAADEAVETLANRPDSAIVEQLGAMPSAARADLLIRHARERWRQKVHFARLRVQRLGWEAACHQTALEILGFRFNRAPMLRLAAAWPLARWAAGDVQPDALFDAERSAWSLQGVRPANHPRRRLRQYAEWVRAAPDWPARLAGAELGLRAPASETATAPTRKAAGLTALRANLSRALTGGALGGPRLDTMTCDGWLPLVVAHAGFDLHGLWFHWFPGDLPPVLVRSLRQLGLCGDRLHPAAHGWAQGLIGWLVERERAAPPRG